MKKLLWGTMLFALLIVLPISTRAAANIYVDISLPPPIVFQAPPEVIVIPDTHDVYVVPTIDVDLFFWNGWWWRLWEGRWYRSHYYDRSWGYYDSVPSFYFEVDPGWRGYYRDHNWYGHRWNYERIPYHQLQQNWKSWHNDRHWERQRTWDVQGYRPRPQHQIQELRQQRQQQYQQRPEVQRHQQLRPPRFSNHRDHLGSSSQDRNLRKGFSRCQDGSQDRRSSSQGRNLGKGFNSRQDESQDRRSSNHNTLSLGKT